MLRVKISNDEQLKYFEQKLDEGLRLTHEPAITYEEKQQNASIKQLLMVYKEAIEDYRARKK